MNLKTQNLKCLTTPSIIWVGDTYEVNLSIIFDQWPKLYSGLNLEAEIQILNFIYFAGAGEM